MEEYKLGSDKVNIEEIKERLKTASQGPWKFEIIDNGRDTDCGGFVDTNGIRIMDFGDSEQYYPSSGDAPSGYDIKFIENAHTDILYLLSIIEIAEKGLESVANSGARETMRRYAEEALQAIRKGE